MMTGIVTVHREAVSDLLVQGTSGEERSLEAIIDTGYNGALTLPSTLIAALGLPWRRRARALLADGSERLIDIYEGFVRWDGALRRIPIDTADTTPLVGMRLLEGHQLTLQAVAGGQVHIEKLA